MNNRIIKKRCYHITYNKLLLCIFIMSIHCFAVAADIVLINQPLTEEDSRYNYPQKLLTYIFAATEAQYGATTIKHAQYKMVRDRALRELELGVNIHVMAEASKPVWEERLIPIRIPIRKGIQGYRTFLILEKNQNMLSEINTLDALKKIPTGSGGQWSTTDILEKNGFNVVTGNNYDGLFSMLIKERFITFGRGINETEEEYNHYKHRFPELSIEQSLLLYIPLPTYFFVTPTQPELAKRIEIGLQIMIENGEFDKLFNEAFAQQIKNANLDKRRVFSIKNPNLSPQTPLEIKAYWYQP